MNDLGLAFKHYDISQMGVARAIRDVTMRIELEERAAGENLQRVSEPMQCTKASAIIHDLLGIDLVFENHVEAVVTTQSIVQSIVKSNYIVDDVDAVVNEAKAYAAKFLGDPAHQYFFVTKENQASAPTNSVAVAAGIDIKVEVKADGKIKKGGKEVLANALYTKYVEELNGAPYENQAFIAILVKELGMTKAGATTYNYNMKKKHGGAIAAKKAK